MIYPSTLLPPCWASHFGGSTMDWLRFLSTGIAILPATVPQETFEEQRGGNDGRLQSLAPPGDVVNVYDTIILRHMLRVWALYRYTYTYAFYDMYQHICSYTFIFQSLRHVLCTLWHWKAELKIPFKTTVVRFPNAWLERIHTHMTAKMDQVFGCFWVHETGGCISEVPMVVFLKS